MLRARVTLATTVALVLVTAPAASAARMEQSTARALALELAAHASRSAPGAQKTTSVDGCTRHDRQTVDCVAHAGGVLTAADGTTSSYDCAWTLRSVVRVSRGYLVSATPSRQARCTDGAGNSGLVAAWPAMRPLSVDAGKAIAANAAADTVAAIANGQRPSRAAGTSCRRAGTRLACRVLVTGTARQPSGRRVAYRCRGPVTITVRRHRPLVTSVIVGRLACSQRSA